MSYRATARLEDDWWIVEVDDIGVTQARTIPQVFRMASDLVYAITDVKGVDVDVRFVGGVFDEIGEVRRMQERAEKQMADASSAMRGLVAALLDAGVSRSDIARVLGVSRQRASQLSQAARETTEQEVSV